MPRARKTLPPNCSRCTKLEAENKTLRVEIERLARERDEVRAVLTETRCQLGRAFAELDHQTERLSRSRRTADRRAKAAELRATGKKDTQIEKALGSATVDQIRKDRQRAQARED